MNLRKTILVTGGAGFIGTHLCRKLRLLGHTVRSLDLKQPSTPVAGVEYLQGDVRDTELLAKAMKGAAVVYHLAATVSVPLCQKDPVESYSNNFSSTLAVLERIRAAKQAGSESNDIRLVFASTAALYGAKGDDGRSLKEEDVALQFNSFYAAQKHASEQAIGLFKQSFDIPAVCFRFFNVFGPGQDPSSPYSGVITLFSKLAKEGRDLPLNAGGIQTRDFISVYDIVQGLTAALDLPRSAWDARAFNLGTGLAITVRELGSMIAEAAGKGSQLTQAPPREGDVMHSKSDISRAKETFGFKPTVELRQGLTELLNYI